MKRRFVVSLLAVSLFGLPLMVGCDRVEKKDETVKTNSDGSQSKDSKTVTKDANGNTTVTEEHKKTPPPP